MAYRRPAGAMTGLFLLCAGALFGVTASSATAATCANVSGLGSPQQGLAGTALTFGLTITDNGIAACNPTRYYVSVFHYGVVDSSGSFVDGWVATPDNFEGFLIPRQIRGFQFSVTSPLGAAPGIYTLLSAVVVDGRGPDDELEPVNHYYEVTAVNPVPVPAALPLLAGGLGALGLIGWRRRPPA